MTRLRNHAGRAAAATLSLVAALAAQQQPSASPPSGFGARQQPQEPVRSDPLRPGGATGNLPNAFLSPDMLLGGQGMFGGQGGDVDGTSSIWSRPRAPSFKGFPVFPSRLSGYGNYPLPVDPDAIGGAGALSGVGTLAPAPAEPPGWPAWVRTSHKQPLPFAVDRGLLIASAERVWLKTTPEEPFVPLFFHDAFASLAPGAEVEVRQTGQFEVLLHTSTRVETRGRTHLDVVALDQEAVHLRLTELSWVRITAGARKNRIELPDGSTLEFEGPPAPEGGAPNAPLGAPRPNAPSPFGVAPPAGFAALFGGAAAALPSDPLPEPARVELVRADEPGWYGGRATIANLGGQELVWRHAFGVTRIARSQRVTVLLTPPAASADGDDARAPVGAPLGGVGADIARDEAGAAVCRRAIGGDDAAHAEWCGARFELPAGVVVRFESLQGDGLAPAPAAATVAGVAGADG